MKRKQAISNKSFGKLLKMFKKHVINYINMQIDNMNYQNPHIRNNVREMLTKNLDVHLLKLHNTYKRKPFHGISKYIFETQFGQMKIGFQFDEKFKNVNFKMLVKPDGKLKFARKRQINIKISS